LYSAIKSEDTEALEKIQKRSTLHTQFEKDWYRKLWIYF